MDTEGWSVCGSGLYAVSDAGVDIIIELEALERVFGVGGPLANVLSD